MHASACQHLHRPNEPTTSTHTKTPASRQLHKQMRSIAPSNRPPPHLYCGTLVRPIKLTFLAARETTTNATAATVVP